MDCRRVALIAVAATLGCGVRPVALPWAGDARLVVVGDVVLPALNAPGRPRTDVGGLSGAYYDAGRNRLYAVADDRERPRVLGFDLSVAPVMRLVLRELVVLQSPPGQRRTLDAEGLAPAPNGNWFVSSEGDPAALAQPVAGIHEYTRDGRFVRSLPLPRAYLGVVGDDSAGMRLNLALETLSVSPDRTRLFAALESSLLQDGPVGDFERGAVVRILVYDLRNLATPPREYAYRADPMPRPAAWAAADGDAGVVDVLALSNVDLLVLERGYVVEAGASPPRRENTIRIYRVRLDRAAEITGRASLTRDPPGAVLEKRPVLDLSTMAPDLQERLRGLENFEALTFGPRLPDGSSTLLVLSDDNFSPGQVTALIAFRWAR
ncbi:MAG: esterase-like activity of phytase family protein [Vicinamibacterales bacterium]